MSHGVKQRLEEVQALRQRLSPSSWQEADWGLADQVLAAYERVLTALVEAQITLSQLLNLLHGHRRKPRLPEEAKAASRGEGGGEQAAAADSALPEERAAAAATAKPRGGHRPGTGRLGADAYAGAKHVECRHEE